MLDRYELLLIQSKYDMKSPLTPDFGIEIKLKLNKQKSIPCKNFITTSGTNAPIIGYNIKYWNKFITLQRDCGEPPEINEVDMVAIVNNATDVVTIIDAVELLIDAEYLSLFWLLILEVPPVLLPVLPPLEVPLYDKNNY